MKSLPGKFQPERLSGVVRVIKDTDPVTWHLVDADIHGNEFEEKVFTVQGVIGEKILPPVSQVKQ